MSRSGDRFAVLPILKKMPNNDRKLNSVLSGVLRSSKKLHELQQHTAVLQQHIQNLERDLKEKNGLIYSFSGGPSVHFITNQLDATGAPLIFMDAVNEFIDRKSNIKADLHTYAPTDPAYVDALSKRGIKVVVHERRDLIMEFEAGDVVVLNTVAHSAPLKDSIYEALEQGQLKKLIWYMHEDWPQIFFSLKERKRIRELIDKGKIEVFLPAVKAMANHRKIYAGSSQNIKLLPYKVKLPAKYYRVRQAADFDKLTFLMIGKTGEGLKGQLPILYAFLDFKQTYYDKNPEQYRKFELRFAAIEEDYLSLQILRHSGSLGEHFKHYPPLPHDGALDMIMESNITICYSMRECLPIFVYEGMAMGHPILRNDVSGQEEQLEIGKNGLFLDSNDFYQVVSVIETILNTNKTSGKKLSSMSKRSVDISKSTISNNYSKLVESVIAEFKSKT